MDEIKKENIPHELGFRTLKENCFAVKNYCKSLKTYNYTKLCLKHCIMTAFAFDH